MLDDRLVARGQHGLELTPRGQQLAGPVSRLLESARAIVSPPSFDPATASGRYTLAAHDHLALLIVPGLMARFARLAPGLDLTLPSPPATTSAGSPTAPWTWPWACSTRCPPACTGVRCTKTGWPACCAPAIPTPPP